MTVRVFLQQNVAGLGRAGEVVTVSQAYARNFLLPQGLAVIATPGLIAKAQQVVEQAAAAKDHAAAIAQEAASKLQGQTITLAARANPQGKLFAAVKTEQVLTAIQAQTGIRLPPATKLEPAQLKTLGDHSVHLTVGHQSINLTIHLDHANKS